MKKVLITIIYFCSTILLGQSTWYKSTLTNQEDMKLYVDFINADFGYAVNWDLPGNGTMTIYKSTNKGVNWSLVGNLGSVVSQIGPIIKFIDENIGFLICATKLSNEQDEIYVYKTTNGGLNWYQWSNYFHNYHWGHWGEPAFFSLDFKSTSLAYLSTESAVYKSTDLFQTWDTVLHWNPNQMFLIHGFNASSTDNNKMFAGSGTSYGWMNSYPWINVTTNGGNNWTIYNGSSTDFGAVWSMDLCKNSNNEDYIKFIGPSSSYRPNTISKFENGNFNVISKFSNQFPNLYGAFVVSFMNSNDGILNIGEMENLNVPYKIIGTSDGGLTWNSTPEYISDVGTIINEIPFFKCNDVRLSTGYGNNSTFLLIRTINANLFAKSDYTEANTTSTIMNLYDYVNDPNNNVSVPNNLNVSGGKQNVQVFSSNENNLFYKWNSGLYSYNPLNPQLENYYVDKNGEGIIANFKTKQKSTTSTAFSNPSATSNSPQTRMIKDYNGNISQVHESMGGIFFSRSTNNGANWMTEEVVNGGTEYYNGFPSENTTENNSYPSICELTTLYYMDPYTSTNSGINVASAWQRYNTNTGKIELRAAFRQQNGSDYFWRKYGNNINNFGNNNGIIKEFNVSNSGYVSKPSIISSWEDFGSGQINTPFHYMILIPHLEPSSSSGNMLTVTAKLEDYGIANHVQNATTTGGNTFIIDNENVTDFSVTAKPYIDENCLGGYILYFTYLKNGNVYYRADKYVFTDIANIIGIHRLFHDGVAGSEIALDISNNDGAGLQRVSPDISLRNGKPVITYRGKKYLEVPVIIDPDDIFYINLYDYPVIVKYKYPITNGELWSSFTYFKSSGNTQENPNVEGNKTYPAYLLNFKFGNSRHKQFVFTDHIGTCSPRSFTGTDAKLVRGTFSGNSFPNSSPMLLTLSQSGSLYNINKQSFTVSNPANPDPDMMSNLIGIIREQNMNYNFNLGPVIAKNCISTGFYAEGSIDNLVEFNSNLVSAPFQLGTGDTLILGGKGHYGFMLGEPFTQKRFTVNL